jgi:hypothetical protein
MSLTLHQLQRNIKGFDLKSEVRSVLVATDNEITEANRDQLWEGKNSDGTLISPAYSDLTISMKFAKGQPGDRVTLRDTGAFYESFKVDVKNDTFEILATDSKAGLLMKKYGKMILGLSIDSLNEYIKTTFWPTLRNRITSKTGLKFGS